MYDTLKRTVKPSSPWLPSNGFYWFYVVFSTSCIVRSWTRSTMVLFDIKINILKESWNLLLIVLWAKVSCQSTTTFSNLQLFLLKSQHFVVKWQILQCNKILLFTKSSVFLIKPQICPKLQLFIMKLKLFYLKNKNNFVARLWIFENWIWSCAKWIIEPFVLKSWLFLL